MFCRALNCRRLGLLNELLVKTRILRNQACNSNKIYLPLDSNVSTVIAVKFIVLKKIVGRIKRSGMKLLKVIMLVVAAIISGK